MIVLLMSVLAQAPDAELLKKLNAHDDRMEQFLELHPMAQHAKVLELDSDGKTKHTTLSEGIISRVSGHQVTVMSACTRDGEDDLPGAKDRAKKRDEENKRVESPFATRNRGRYEFTVLGPDAKEPKMLRIGYKPVGDVTGESTVGEAVVDPEAGEVVKLTFSLAKKPPMVDRLDMVREFNVKTSAGRMMSLLKVSAAGGILFVKERREIVTQFDYPK